MNKTILRSLAPEGRLRAAINLSNFLLVPRVLADGTPTGTSPDVAAQIATELDVECEFICFGEAGVYCGCGGFRPVGYRQYCG